MNPPLLDNILAQPESLREVAAYQLGEGRQSLAAAAEVLRSSRRIVFTGMGASLFACTPLAYALSAHGVSVCAIESSELLYFLSPVLGRDTAVVLVSRSGESVEVIRLVPLLQERGCRTIGVFNVRESTLAKRTEQPVF
ncbi:MAG: SIS domain-containing protein, partial [Acidobacteriaceae bacterium]|nr:SIS domain-containing protein [Acidobacteriaceae bacterium]